MYIVHVATYVHLSITEEGVARKRRGVRTVIALRVRTCKHVEGSRFAIIGVMFFWRMLFAR